MIRLAMLAMLLLSSACHGQINVFADRLPETKPSQTLVTRHLYLACVDTEAKQPAWLAYRIRKSDWETGNQLARNFNTPKELRAICLEPGDYEKSGMEMGHLYALQFVQARNDAHEVNQLCAIAAQSPGLNKGPWFAAETEMKAASETETVTVLAGQLWLNEMPPLTKANEPHKVASHQFLIWSTPTKSQAYLFPQSAKRGDTIEQYRIDRVSIEKQIADNWIDQ